VTPRPKPTSLSAAPHDRLGHALLDCVRRPHRALLRAWSWKTAAMSAFFRAMIFLFANRHAGEKNALTAGLVEAVFAIFASGLLGAVTQRLRDARPLWATALVVWLGMPGLMTVAQWAVHRQFATAHLAAGLISSFVFAAVASGFTWYAMRRGVLLTGVGGDTVSHDAKTLPRVILDFVLWPVRRSRG